MLTWLQLAIQNEGRVTSKEAVLYITLTRDNALMYFTILLIPSSRAKQTNILKMVQQS